MVGSIQCDKQESLTINTAVVYGNVSNECVIEKLSSNLL